jgi:hypothetical protein
LPDEILKAVRVGFALERLRTAEQDFWSLSNQHQICARAYAAMLEHHRHAYVSFMRIARELNRNQSVSCGHLEFLLSNLQHHLGAAETAQQASLGAS